MAPPDTISRPADAGKTAGQSRGGGAGTVDVAGSDSAPSPDDRGNAQPTAEDRAETARAGSWQRAQLLMATSAFRQASAYVAAVMVVGAIITWLLFERTNDAASRQLIDAIAIEIDGIADLTRVAGANAAIDVVRRRAAIADQSPRSGASTGRGLYLLENAAGSKLAGNLASWPEALDPQGGGPFEYAAQDRPSERRLAAGLVRDLPGGMRILAGRDLEPQQRLARELRFLFLTGFGALALIGLAAGIIASRLALGRISQVKRTSDAIMAGDLSGRVPISANQDELDDLARNLNAMLDRIEQLMAGLREVSDNIAHDLKTPLTRLRAQAEAALRAGEGADHYRDVLERVIEDADELIKTFNALLLIARLEAGAVADSVEPFDLVPLVADVAELYGPVAEEAGLQLACAVGGKAEVRANRQLIGQAIANMIDNAIKYGAPRAGGSMQAAQGAVAVEVATRGNEVVVSVADHGPGIAAADRERVLKRFVRLEASRTRPGTGLGLSLVSAVARLHGGSVGLEDNKPGLRISIALPLLR
jgi:signal transduction histidine kinase